MRLWLLLVFSVHMWAVEGGPVGYVGTGAPPNSTSLQGEGYTDSNSTPPQGDANKPALNGVPIVTLNWNIVMTPFIICMWILGAWLAKLVFELNPKLTMIIPESALLIMIGFALGGMIWGANKTQTFTLQPVTFFYFLLPQIILDAGYSMPNKLFFGNLGAILLFAVIGTCWNAGTVGVALWGVYMGGAMGNLNIGLLQFLLFGSLLSAVDPVAVLAVFEQVHVNEVLFIVVFGESLLNDGVTVVLYNVCDAFVTLGGDRINGGEIVKGIVSFLVVAFGGTLIGVAFAILISIITRYTKNIEIIEPGFIFVLGYLSYLTAEMLSLSSILSITFYGICCQRYVNANMAESSVATVKYAMKVFANGSETIIFVFLGISAIDPNIWVWNTAFILLTVFFVLAFRIIGCFTLTWFLNRFRLIPIELIDQVILSYGGLRGAVAYGLAFLLDGNKIKEKNLMISTTLIVVYTTVILQGVTMKPLVKWLKVKRSEETEILLIQKLQNRAFDHILVAIEDVSGQIGNNYMQEKWNKFEQNWLRPMLMKPSARKQQDCLFNVYHKLNLKDATNYVTDGERRGSLAFLRSDNNAFVDFKKKLGSDISDSDASDMIPYTIPMPPMRQDRLPSVGLDIDHMDKAKQRDHEDINTHHLLQTHLYKARKQHRHSYSRSHMEVNKDENEVQEIFQRTMRSRLESFKSTKMGPGQNKSIKKLSKKNQVPNGKSNSHPYGDEDFPDVDHSDYAESGGEHPMRTFNRSGGGIENPAFMPDGEPAPQTPPWNAGSQVDDGTAPSLRAQARMPWSPSNMGRLAPLRNSTHSTDSFQMADRAGPEAQQPPSNKPGTHM